MPRGSDGIVDLSGEVPSKLDIYRHRREQSDPEADWHQNAEHLGQITVPVTGKLDVRLGR